MANFDRAGRIVEIGPKTRSDCFIAEHGVPLWNRRRVDPNDVAALVKRARAHPDTLTVVTRVGDDARPGAVLLGRHHSTLAAEVNWPAVDPVFAI